MTETTNDVTGEEIERPDLLQINAWSGTASPKASLPRSTPWAQRQTILQPKRHLLAPPPADPRDWTHPDIGWGLVLPDRDGVGAADLARGEDAPAPIRRLLAARGHPPVLRYRPDLETGFLRRYYPDRGPQDLSVGAPWTGTAVGRIPRYLLICAPPAEIPWSVQYVLNLSVHVGRLDLPDEGLENYVEALVTDWGACRPDPTRPVVWSTDDGENDITWLMGRAVADKVWERYAADRDLEGGRRLDGQAATGSALAAAVAELSPGLVVTTSHGMTGPLDDPARLLAQLGAPVDADHRPIYAGGAAPPGLGGAIWYAHACCSAGSDDPTRYAGVLPASGSVGETMGAVAHAAGARTAPLPQALLGAKTPLRAFVGHVEPTFDWTLRDPTNKQVLASAIVSALYDRLYQSGRPTPIGLALAENYREAGQFFALAQDSKERINRNIPQSRDWLLYRMLVAMDRQTLVILGDPTVALPLSPGPA